MSRELLVYLIEVIKEQIKHTKDYEMRDTLEVELLGYQTQMDKLI